MTYASRPSPRPSTFATLGIALLVAALWAPTAGAYDQYSVDRDATNCRACHTNDDPYIPDSDGISWGSSIHRVHTVVMLADDCAVCHGATDFPVALDSSTGGIGFEAIGCVGCHGRNEDMGFDSESLGRGAGLRQHHTRAGVSDCLECHSDADPSLYTPVAENVAPPYYFTPDADHPAKPSVACSPGGEENFAGGPEGLDNDGDGLWDLSDPDCDADGDGIPDDADGDPATQNPCSCQDAPTLVSCTEGCDDNCPFRPNADQLDRGGVDSAQYSPGDGSPDDIGDACQCGDMNGDGMVSTADVVDYRLKFAGQSGPFSTDRCSVIGPNGICDGTDVVIMRRTFVGQTRGILQNVCPAFVGLPDPGTP